MSGKSDERLPEGCTSFGAPFRKSPHQTTDHRFIPKPAMLGSVALLMNWVAAPADASIVLTASRSSDRELPCPRVADPMLKLALNAELSSLTTMADAVEAYAADHAVPQDKTLDLILALDEVVTNVISHGGVSACDTIAVSIDVGADAISAVVEDHGSAFDPLHDAPPYVTGSLQERPLGGLGLHIVRTIMKELSYQRVDGRNVLLMRLPL